MFYSDVLLTKKGPLAPIWLASTMEKKLSRSQILNIQISQACQAVTNQPLALRMLGRLLLGIVKIYSRKARYLADDCYEALIRLKTVFQPASIDLPANSKRPRTLNLSNSITELDLLVPQLPPELNNDLLITQVPTRFAENVIHSPSSSSMISRLDHITLPDYNDSIEVARDNTSLDIDDDDELRNFGSEGLDLNFNFANNASRDQRADISGNSDDIEIPRDANIPNIDIRAREDDFDDFAIDFQNDPEDSFASVSGDIEPSTPGLHDLGDLNIDEDLNINTRRPRKIRKITRFDKETEISQSTLKQMQQDRSSTTQKRLILPSDPLEQMLHRFSNPFAKIDSYLFDEPVIERMLHMKMTPKNITKFISSNRATDVEMDEGDQFAYQEPYENEFDEQNIIPSSPPNDSNFMTEDHSVDIGNYLNASSHDLNEPLNDLNEPNLAHQPSSAIVSQNTLEMANLLRETFDKKQSSIELQELRPRSKHQKVQQFFQVLVLATKGAIKVEQSEAYGSIEVEARDELYTEAFGGSGEMQSDIQG